MTDKTQDPCGSDLSAELESRRRKSLMWWLGQAIAAFLGVSAVGASGSTTVGLIVFYALAVLVDIRDLLSNTPAETRQTAQKDTP
jgi:hypothetical protein